MKTSQRTSFLDRLKEPLQEGEWTLRGNVATLSTPEGRCYPMNRKTAQATREGLDKIQPHVKAIYKNDEELTRAKRLIEQGISLFDTGTK